MKSISLDQAVALIPDGSSLMIGGFMGVGTPERLVDEIVRQRKKDLTVIANDTAVPGAGIGKLVHAKLVRAAIVSHIGLNPEAQAQMMAASSMCSWCHRVRSSSGSARRATVSAAF